MGIQLKKTVGLCWILIFLSGGVGAFQTDSSSNEVMTQELVEMYANLEKANKSNDTTEIVRASLNLLGVLENMNQWGRGRELGLRLPKLVKGVKNDTLKIKAYMKIGTVTTPIIKTNNLTNKALTPGYFQKQDSIIFWIKKGEQLAIQKGLKSPLLNVYRQLGTRYYFKARMGYGDKEGHRNFDTAFVYLDRLEKLGYELDRKDKVISSLVWQAYAHIKEEKYTEGYEKIFEAYSLSKTLDSELSAVEMANIFDAMFGNYVRMLESNKSDTLLWIRSNLTKWRNRQNRADLAEEIADMDRQYETTFTKDQLSAQEELNQLQQTQLGQRNVIIGIVALLFLSAGGGGIFFFRLNRKNKLLAENNALLVKEQNHRVKNNLQMISSLLSLQANQAEGSSKETMLDGSRRVQAIALLHRKLYDDLEGVKEVNIKEFAEELIEDLLFASGKQHIPVKLNLESVTLPVEKSVHLALILNELITNSIKHVFSKPQLNGECLELSVSEEASKILVQYRDHSGSFDVEVFDNSDSLGNQIIRSQSQYLSKNWSVKNEHGFSYRLSIS